MRILHVITSLDRGGAEKALLALCRGSQGHRLAVAYLKGKGELAAEFQAAGVAVHDLDVRGLRAARSLGRLASLVRAFAPDVVHSHLFKADVLAASVVGGARAARPALVSTKHNVDLYLTNPVWRGLGRAAARRADAVIAISDGVAQFLRETLGERLLRRPIAVVRYGIEPSSLPRRAPPGTGTMLCVARFAPQKDHDTLFDGAVLAARERPMRLVLVGRGALESALRERARTMAGVDISFAGFTDDPTPHYDAADVIVLPSRWEGLGLVLVEAALRGRPAIATDVGGIAEVVVDRTTGMLVPPGDPRALADAMLTLAANPDRAAQLGRNAEAHARERFSVARTVADTERIYERVCGEAQ